MALIVEITESKVRGRSIVVLQEPMKTILGIDVPAGFESDLASSPRLLWTIAPPLGRYAPAAVLHDWLYKTHWTTGPDARMKADNLFSAQMALDKVPLHMRRLLYAAVRFGGGKGWERDHDFLEKNEKMWNLYYNSEWSERSRM